VELIHTCYRITDPEASVAFYEALGFFRGSEWGRTRMILDPFERAD